MNDVARFVARSGPGSWFAATCLWLAGVLGAVALLPADVFVPGAPIFILTLGGLAIWRWSWGLLHFSRAFLYTRFVFPAMARRARASAPPAPHVAVVVMSWRIEPEVHAAVMDGLVRDLMDYGAPATIVLSASDPADADVLEVILDRRGARNVSYLVTYQEGKGKRHGMYVALNALATVGLPPGGLVVLMDGDTYVPAGTLAGTAPLVLADERVGALTLDNIPLVAGSWWTREWYRLRMAQRYVYMSSLSLSRKVLVLTGRWSLFRADLVLQPSFAAQILNDAIYHSRLGKIEMLTGEDKSTWHWVAARGWDILFVPDARIHPMEELPRGGFVSASAKLMMRWFGNMFRGGVRGLEIGPGTLGLFPWLVLLDQRIAMWTTLTGPAFFGLLAAVLDWRFLALFALWVSLSRFVQATLVAGISGRFHPAFIHLLFYGQVVGALVKVYVFFHPHVQRWTRQNTGASAPAGSTLSRALMVLSVTLFFGTIVLFSGVLDGRNPLAIDAAAR